MITLTCHVCKSQYTTKNYMKDKSRFCSRRCTALGTVAGRNKQDNWIHCDLCAKPFRVPNCRLSTAKHCSRACHNKVAANAKDNSGIHNPMWKGGIATYRVHRKESCERCGRNYNLVVHHRDENRYNNAQDNLETLCRSCHKREHDSRRPSGQRRPLLGT